MRKVSYPGLKSHPQYELAKRQMGARFGGMVTVILDTDLAGTRRFLENTHLFSLAESLGGVESLVNYPPIMTHGAIPEEQRIEVRLARALGRRGFPVAELGVGRGARRVHEDVVRRLGLQAVPRADVRHGAPWRREGCQDDA